MGIQEVVRESLSTFCISERVLERQRDLAMRVDVGTFFVREVAFVSLPLARFCSLT